MRLDAEVQNGLTWYVPGPWARVFAGVAGFFHGVVDAYLVVMDRADDPADGQPIVMSWPLLAQQPFSHMLAPDYFVPTVGIVVGVSSTQAVYTGVGVGNEFDACMFFEKGLI